MNFRHNLGFGCSKIGGQINFDQSLELLNYIYSKNITHFDLSPSYGDGNCHKVFREFISNKDRSKIFLSTKIGEIENNKITRYRKIKSNFNFIKKLIKYFLPNLSTTKKIEYNEKIAKNIVKKYLSELNTNYIDSIFLHNINNVNEIKKYTEILEKEKENGRLKYIGISLNSEIIFDQELLNRFDLIQIENSFDRNNYEFLKQKYNISGKKFVFYGLNQIFDNNLPKFDKFKKITNIQNYRLFNLLNNISVEKNSITLINTSKKDRIDEIVLFMELINKDRSILNIIND